MVLDTVPALLVTEKFAEAATLLLVLIDLHKHAHFGLFPRDHTLRR